MTTAEAIRKANQLVIIDNYGNGQYRVRHYSHKHQAWWEGNITNRETALRELHTERVQMALELLEIEDAGALANSCTYNAYPKDWRQCVRDEIKADNLAESQTA
jgi:hypothetical protein